jgi:hypothetical protein
MNDTPETDEAQFGTGRVSVDFARKLKRERDEAREELDNIRKTLSESGEAIGNGVHNYSIIEMSENLIQSRDYFVRKSDSLEQERDEAREALTPFISLNPNSQRVKEKWDGFVQAAKKALEAAK